MTVGSIPRHLVAFSLPMLVGSFLHTAYSFVNAIWVGQLLGTAALAAVTVSFPVVFALIALGGGLTMAANVLIAQRFGAHDLNGVGKAVDSSVVMVGALSLLLAGVGQAFAPAILRAMDTPPSVLSLAESYARIFLMGLPFGFGLFLTRSMLQGIGDSATPLYFQGASVGINTVLDPLLMFGWLGLPRLGLNGAAWASVIAQGLALTALFVHLQRRQTPVTPNWRRPRLDWATVWLLIRIGVPSAVQQAFVSIGMVFVTGIVNRFGPTATAAFGAAIRIDQIAFMPAMSFSLAVTTLSGQNIGAQAFDRVRHTFRWGVLLSGGVTLVISALAVSVPGALLRIFTSDAAVISLGVHYLRIVGGSYLLFAIMFASNGVINSAGHTVVTTLISLVTLWVVRVPVAYALTRRMHSVEGVWYAIVLSFAVGLVLSLLYYFSGRWQHPIAGRSPVPPTPETVLADEIAEA